MKSLMLILCMFTALTIHAESPFARSSSCCKPPRGEQDLTANQDKVIIITNMVTIVTHLIQLLADLNNKEDPQARARVIQNAIAMARSIGNIAIQTCKCVSLGAATADEILEYVEQECEKAHVEVTITQDLLSTIKRAYARSALLPQETRARYAEYAEHSDTLNG